MNIPQVIAKAVYFIDGDDTASEYQSSIIEYQGARWIVSTWLIENATGKRIPDRIVPLAKLPHVMQPDGIVRLGLLIPKELFSVSCPSELLRTFSADCYPALAQTHPPGSIH